MWIKYGLTRIEKGNGMKLINITIVILIMVCLAGCRTMDGAGSYAGAGTYDLDTDITGEETALVTEVDEEKAGGFAVLRIALSDMPVSDDTQAALDLKQDASTAATDTELSAGLALKLNIADIDDTSVNGETSAPISSNWAYDHENSSDAHPGYVKDGEIDTAAEINALTTDEDFLVDSDINSTVQGYDANTALTTDITYETLNTNGDVGTSAGQLSIGNHTHTGVYEPADATILKDADIGVNVQAYSSSNALTTDITYETLDANSDVGTGSSQVAAGDHSHAVTGLTATNWRVFYSADGGAPVELALGASGTYLRSNGASSAPTFDTPSGSGDVSKVGTPANHQFGIWTGDGTLEGVSVTGSSVIKTDADGEPVACSNLTDTDFSDADNISDGSTNAIPTLTQESNWDTAYGLVGAVPLDSDFTSNGLMKRTGAGTYDIAVADTDYLTPTTAASTYQPLESTLTDIATGTITENLVNTANPWADNEVADDISLTNITQITTRPITSLTATNYRLFYSADGGVPVELAFGADGTYLRSNGASAALTFDTPGGSGDMLQSVYDTGANSKVDDSDAFTTVDTGDEAATFYPILVDGATGTQVPETDAGLSYNPSTNTLNAGVLTEGGTAVYNTTESDAAYEAELDDSSGLAAALSDETGTGNAVFSNSPTLVTPSLGTPSALTLTNATGLPLTTGVTGILPQGNGGIGADISGYTGLIGTTTGTPSNITDAAGLETILSMGAYFSDTAAATSEANFKSITNLEAGTDYNDYSAYLADIASLTPTANNLIGWNSGGTDLENKSSLNLAFRDTTPEVLLRDSDAAGTDDADKDAASIKANMSATTEDAEVSDVWNTYFDAGTEQAFSFWDGSDWALTIGIMTDSSTPAAVSGYEALTFDFNTATDNQVEIRDGLSTGITEINIVGIDLKDDGSAFLVSGGALGTPSSGTLTNCTGLPTSGLTDGDKGDISNSSGTLTIDSDAIDEANLYATNSPTDNYILSYDSGTGGFTWVVDATGSGSLGTNLSSSTNDIASDTGIIQINGTGNTNNEDLDFDFETTANTVDVSSDTGVTDIILTGIDMTVGGSDVSLGTAGVKLTGDGDGAITLLGLGDGNDEDITINLDDTANTAVISSSTGLDAIDTGDIAMISKPDVQTDSSGAITIIVNAINYGTDTGDADIPDGACDSAGDVGNWVVLISDTADQYSLTSDDASNYFILDDNTALDAGDELDVDGTMVSVMCVEAEVWKVVGYIDTAPTDGGVAD